jgi:amino acid adenylation domain-containing protein
MINFEKIHHGFEYNAKLYPKRLAVVFGDKSITYEELDIQSSVLATSILNSAQDHKIIGLSTTRSIDMVVGMVAILKSGKAYMPIDPDFPIERKKYMVELSKLRYIIAPEEEANIWNDLGLSKVQLNSIDSEIVFPENNEEAVILFTSGSTGKPKGVVLCHKGLCQYLNFEMNYPWFNHDAKTLQFSFIGFDHHILEIFGTFFSGGELHLIAEIQRLDSFGLLEYIISNKISRVYLPNASFQYFVQEALSSNRFPTSLTEITSAGELLKISDQTRLFFSKIPNAVLKNSYGPTEAFIVTELVLSGDPYLWDEIPSLGKEIAGFKLWVLDKEMKELPVGEIGELYIGGNCLADGYLNRPDLTKEKFINWVSLSGQEIRLYKSGDLVLKDENGHYHYKGREDDQVKIRGNRVEIGEVELALNKVEGVRLAVVKLDVDAEGHKFLCAYLQFSDSKKLSLNQVKEDLKKSLPDYMVPDLIIEVQEFPRTSSGKVDKKALPTPVNLRPEWMGPILGPSNKIEIDIQSSFKEVLNFDKIGVNDNFFELGGNSLKAQALISKLKNYNNYIIPVTKFYQFPTIKGLANYLIDQNLPKTTQRIEIKTNSQNHSVAIIGIGLNFPGAQNIQEFLEILRNGRETIRFFDHEELDVSISTGVKKDIKYVAARGIIEDYDRFDPGFFGFNPKLASIADPQMRKFFEVAYSVLEQTGYRISEARKDIGVFAGVSKNTYFTHNLRNHHSLLESYGDFLVSSLNEKDYIASRTAYHLNLTGPAVSVHSACSTSLLAVSQAVESIRAGKCDMALAGGSSIHSPVKSGHIYEEGSINSKDGHVNSFDANAHGTVFSDGVGVVLLKNMELALEDGDDIWAVIEGTGVNNDGSEKGSFSGPSAEGQANAIASAMKDASVQPEEIGYIEAHATATPIGDPIEIEGLKMAFGNTSINQYCVVGSIKANLGHLNAASGIAGLMKAIMVLKFKQFFPQINYKKPNPAIEFNNSPFYVNTELKEWVSDSKRIAGVSSFGVGGTNVHLILGEAPENNQKKQAIEKSELSEYLIPWSAKSKESLNSYAKKLCDFLQFQPNLELSKITSTLLYFRHEYSYRTFLIAKGREDLIEKLQKSIKSKEQTKNLKEFAFLFPGQGAQYLNMGKGLYYSSNVFKQALDACSLILEQHFGFQLLNILFPRDENESSEVLLIDTQYTQPAIFSISYALSQMWMGLGIKPKVLCGHSIGEFVAAHLSGVFSLEDALKLVAKRGKLISSLPEGSMLSVRCSEEEIKFFLPENLSLAGVNGQNQIVVAGRKKDILDFEDFLKTKDIPSKPLKTSHAFHSFLMDPILEEFEAMVTKVSKNKPTIPIISTLTGKSLTDEEALSSKYWVDQLRYTVRFEDAVKKLLSFDLPLSFLEVGPGNVLTSILRQRDESENFEIFNSICKTSKFSEFGFFLNQLGLIWQTGRDIQWEQFFEKDKKPLAIPTYAFRKQKIWLDPIANLQEFLSIPQPQIDLDNARKETNNYPIENRKYKIYEKLRILIEEVTGLKVPNENASFFELGFDSLLLTQLSVNLMQTFNVKVSFRQLNDNLSDLTSLLNYLDEQLPSEFFAENLSDSDSEYTVLNEIPKGNFQNINSNSSEITNSAHSNTEWVQLFSRQLELMSNQLQLISKNHRQSNEHHKAYFPEKRKAKIEDNNSLETTKVFGAMAKIEKIPAITTPEQDAFIQNLIKRFNEKTKRSKDYTQKHRAKMADPRVVSGFKPNTKEITYSLVVNRSEGSKIWDIDGNEYLDVLNGFGAILFGHKPEFVQKAVKEQLEKGYEVGPQHILSGEVCDLICELTQHERAALCNTGSEAVMAALRISRTVTGRSLVVSFNHSYHGIFDEVIVRKGLNHKSFPAAAGILPSQVENLLVLEYGSDEALEIINERKAELAAVLVEPVQSRRPELHPVEFLKKLREITKESGTALIFDEVITGFRTHLQGAQGLFGIKADIGTYGKVIGGGLPIGAIAGSSNFMDALDGGFWQYGDDSIPEVGVTYFAGTFVRHPLALAAAKASLEHLKADNGTLQKVLAQKTKKLALILDSFFKEKKLPFYIAHFGSMWKLKFHKELPYTDLIFILMREKGIHIYDGFPCYLTTVISENDVDLIIQVFKESVDELLEAGFFGGKVCNNDSPIELEVPPIPGAELGLDEKGIPAWFKRDDTETGIFYKLDL